MNYSSPKTCKDQGIIKLNYREEIIVPQKKKKTSEKNYWFFKLNYSLEENSSLQKVTFKKHSAITRFLEKQKLLGTKVHLKGHI